MSEPTGPRRRVVCAASAVAIVVGEVAGYLWLIDHQGGGPAPWFLAGLGIAGCLGVLGIVATARYRRVALVAAGAVAAVLGLLGLASIGAPLLLAGFLCWGAVAADMPSRSAETSSRP